MRKVRFPLIFVWVALAVACSDQPVTGPDLRVDRGAPGITVLSWNVYVGADVDAIIMALADTIPSNDFPALLAGIEELEATDFLARARAFADVIAARKPHAVGLQEITTFNINLKPIGMDIALDLEFLPIIQGELAARGLNYTVAASILNIDAEPIPGMVRMRDYDVLLVNTDRATLLGAMASNFQVNLVDLIGPVGGIELKRGWAMATVSVDDNIYSILSAHPEPDLGEYDFSELRMYQAMEIVGVLAQAPGGSIVMGDLNDTLGSPMYQQLTDAGFVDIWSDFRPGVEGNTCCHLTDLSNPQPGHTKRIDYIFARGIGHPNAGPQGRIDRLGDVPADRIAGPYYPIWPSDHAGLVAQLVLPPALGIAE